MPKHGRKTKIARKKPLAKYWGWLNMLMGFGLLLFFTLLKSFEFISFGFAAILGLVLGLSIFARACYAKAYQIRAHEYRGTPAIVASLQLPLMVLFFCPVLITMEYGAQFPWVSILATPFELLQPLINLIGFDWTFVIVLMVSIFVPIIIASLMESRTDTSNAVFSYAEQYPNYDVKDGDEISLKEAHILVNDFEWKMHTQQRRELLQKKKDACLPGVLFYVKGYYLHVTSEDAKSFAIHAELPAESVNVRHLTLREVKDILDLYFRLNFDAIAAKTNGSA